MIGQATARSAEKNQKAPLHASEIKAPQFAGNDP
jgi:hypothetical protein